MLKKFYYFRAMSYTSREAESAVIMSTEKTKYDPRNIKQKVPKELALCVLITWPRKNEASRWMKRYRP